MKVLLTGGSGNLGQTLVPVLLDKGNTPVILDVRAPRDLKKGAVFIEGSILDRPKLADIFRGCDCIVHIAAWHGIREDRGEKNSYEFFDLNVRGTFEVFEAGRRTTSRRQVCRRTGAHHATLLLRPDRHRCIPLYSVT